MNAAPRETASLSVVIPLHDKGDYVLDTVRSVLAGPVLPLEIIVVDDGSTDDGPERLEALGEPRVRLIRQANAGVSAARNRGMAEARGELIAFLDADDLWRPGYVASIARQAEAFPHCGVFSTHFFAFDAQGSPTLPSGAASGEGGLVEIDRFYEFWVGARPFCLCSCAFRRPWLEEAGIRFPEGETRGEDQDVIFRAAERWPLSFDPRPLMAYRRGIPGQLSSVAAPGLHPYLDRLRARVEAGEIAPGNRPGARRVLRVAELMFVQELLITGRRGEAFRRLMNPRLLPSPRYWSRLALSLMLPKRLQDLVLPAHGVRPARTGPAKRESARRPG